MVRLETRVVSVLGSILLIQALGAGCRSAEATGSGGPPTFLETACNVYYPLDIEGAWWTYREYDDDGEMGREYTLEATGAQYEYQGQTVYGLGDDGIGLYSCDGWVTVHGSWGATSDVSYSPPRKMLPDRPEVGDTWDNEYDSIVVSVNTETITYGIDEHFVVNAEDAISVPAGSFAAIRVAREREELRTSRWYAPHLGLVCTRHFGTWTALVDHSDRAPGLPELEGHGCWGIEYDPDDDFTVDPGIAWSPTTVDFGELVPGQSVVETIMVTSVGGRQLEVGSISLSQDSSPAISVIENPAPLVLPPTHSVSFDVEYAPDTEGVDFGTLEIESDDPNAELVSLALSGACVQEPDIDVTPQTLSFGEVEIGAVVELDAEISNLGSVNLEVGTLSILGSSEFSLVLDPSGSVLAPGGVELLRIRYQPIDDVSDEAEMTIPSNDPDESSFIVYVDGQHLPLADIEVTPASIDFGYVDFGQSAEETVTVSNVGAADLTVDLPNLTGSSDFEMVAPLFPCLIPPGDEQVVTVRYTPSDLVLDTGEITIASDDPSEPSVTVELYGDVVPIPDVEVSPESLEFGQVMVGDNLAAIATIANIGTADLELGVLAVIGTSEYSITVDPSSMVLPPNVSAAVEVTYSPVDTGQDTAILEIPTNDPDENTVLVTLSGQELPVPFIDVTPTSLDFGAVEVGLSSSQALVVSNLGTATLDVSTLDIDGSAEFSWGAVALPGTLGPGMQATVHVAYSPVDGSPDTAVLGIESNDPDDPLLEVPLSGEPAP